MQVDKVIPAEVRDGEAKELIFDGEARKYHLDLTNQFVRSLQSHFGLSVNQANLERATSELVSR